MDHPGSHRDSVLLTDVLAKSNLVQGAQGSHGHGQVDTLSRDVLQGPDVYELNRIFTKPNQISPTLAKPPIMGVAESTQHFSERRKEAELATLLMIFIVVIHRM